MAIVRNIEIDGRQVPFKASAAIPRIYRARFRRDIFKDLERLATALDENVEGEGEKIGEVRLSALDVGTLETFENIAYIMALHADPRVPISIEAWLDGFNTFSIYQILPRLIELWGDNAAADAELKKKQDQPTARLPRGYTCSGVISLDSARPTLKS